ncbi:nucleotidyltransferase domain-containing protein [Nostoc sp.]|uniref:nucleotidyltransferase domain-containing protein n=1 Tax=Nostoc sp. TaxID=1180 RepID=UPI002FF5BCB6
MHIYAFGSICRGDISLGSDVDLLAIVEGYDSRIDPDTFSIYSYKRIQELWNEGNPFAWHLSLESRLLFSSDKLDYLKALGSPEPYKNCVQDCEKFFALFREAYDSLIANSTSKVFDLSTVFLSIRNIATCFSLGTKERSDFSRNSALCLGCNSIPIALDSYQILERSRLLCTRGHGKNITDDEIDTAIRRLHEVHEWMNNLVEKAKEHERV